jgi:hypothetical protein
VPTNENDQDRHPGQAGTLQVKIVTPENRPAPIENKGCSGATLCLGREGGGQVKRILQDQESRGTDLATARSCDDCSHNGGL